MDGFQAFADKRNEVYKTIVLTEHSSSMIYFEGNPLAMPRHVKEAVFKAHEDGLGVPALRKISTDNFEFIFQRNKK